MGVVHNPHASKGLLTRDWGLGFRVQASEDRVQGSRFRIEGSRFGV